MFLLHLLFGSEAGAIRNIHGGGIIAQGAPVTLRGETVRIYKTHDRLLDPATPHAGVIHVMRHPLDVFLSHLHYLTTDPADYRSGLGVDPPGDWLFALPKRPLDEIIASGEIEHYFGLFVATGTVRADFWRRTGSWFSHNETWAAAPGPVFRFRYETLVAAPETEFTRLADWLAVDPALVPAALDKTRASTRPDGVFFWRQTPYGYRELLPQRLIDAYYARFGERLAALGY